MINCVPITSPLRKIPTNGAGFVIISADPLLNIVARYEKKITNPNPGITSSSFLNVISCIKKNFMFPSAILDLKVGEINHNNINITKDPMKTMKKIVVAQNWIASHADTFPNRNTITVIMANPK